MTSTQEILDNPGSYSSFDLSNMRDHLERFPQECRVAWDKGFDFQLPPEYAKIKSTVVLGMGASGTGGKLLGRLESLEGKVSFRVHQDYGLPPFVNGETLVIASSYSGNTDETISGFTEALETPALKLALTSGGRLGELAREAGIPVFEIGYRSPPRVALPHSFFSLAGILCKTGLLHINTSDLTETMDILSRLRDKLRETNPFEANPAKQLAAGMQGYLPVIYSSGFLAEAGERWKTQLNENSKSAAYAEVFPELCHNAIVGYEFPYEVEMRTLTIMLQSESLFHPLILRRYEAIAQLLSQRGIKFETVQTRGKSMLAQMMSLVLYGDYASFYLAILNEVDPTPVNSIDLMKQYIARDQ